MDLNTLEIPDTIEVHLEFKGTKLYDGKKPVSIELFSPASDLVRDYKRKVQQKAMIKMKRSRTGTIDMTPEEIEEQSIDRLVAFTSNVSNLEFEGEKINPANVRKIYENPKYGWINDQLLEKLGSWDDFLL